VARFPTDFSAFPSASIESPEVLGDGSILAEAGSLIRLLDGGQIANADGDGLADDRDACPLRSAARRNGCERVRLAMREVDAYAGEASGRLAPPSVCRRASAAGAGFRGIWVRLFAVRPGRDPQIARTRAGKRGDWSFDDLSAGGPLYAKVRARHHPGVVDCSSAVSKRIFPGR
jgi:hypothetical protein